MDNEFSNEIDTFGDSSVALSDSDSDTGDNIPEEDESDLREGSSEDSFDADLTNIDTNVDSLVLQIDNLNENVNVLNENVKFGIGLLFVVVFCLMIRFAYHILGSILGLNKA